MNKLIDLHIHTNYSDGEYSPQQIVELVKENNIGTFAITDHDTVLGAKELYNFNDADITYIPGIELSANFTNGIMHILGYKIDVNSPIINNKLDEMRYGRMSRFMTIIKYMRDKYNINFREQDILYLLKHSYNIGRSDIAKLCVKYGYTNSSEEAFALYLKQAGNDIEYENLTPQECISLIKKIGGIPVLAHPVRLNRSFPKTIKIIKNLMDVGLQGIEVYHSEHSLEDTKRFLELAKELNLLYSGGTDFHGEELKPEVKIGTGINNNVKIKKLTII